MSACISVSCSSRAVVVADAGAGVGVATGSGLEGGVVSGLRTGSCLLSLFVRVLYARVRDGKKAKRAQGTAMTARPRPRRARVSESSLCIALAGVDVWMLMVSWRKDRSIF